jgi:hypothetical protein
VRVSWVADGIGAVAQVDGPVGVNRVEILDRSDPLGAVAEQRDRRDVLIGTRRQPNIGPGAAITTSVTAAPSE